MQIHQTITNFITSKTNDKDINLTDNLLSKIKSFDFMMLILELEQKFSLQLPFEQLFTSNISQINQFINWVEQQQLKVA